MENAVEIGQELTRRQARGHSSHQYGPLTGPVTALTRRELIINANQEGGQQQQYRKGHFCPQ